MAYFKLTDQTSVKSLKKQFAKKYQTSLRVYKGQHFADDKLALKELGENAHPTGYLKVEKGVTVEEFEKMFLDTFGVKVQVANLDNSKLAKNDRSLHAAKWA